ncbi:leucyl aminopeptidase [Acuticoccus mangrovi]|uniref:Probable cytosol aminopeptidase n=1 Tax=Acuticoccus mangrovi TaxID=2796142 RepID=A0A934IH93_9HYPH|nr:leucyl aminopeptidase [Acuticoccus mangrovi]MBJ3776674.1 leucyl aminopeptidase [Acuticoccus mangrovi]
MAKRPVIKFAPADLPAAGTLVVFAGDGVALGAAAEKANAASGGLITAAAEAQGFKGKRFSTMSLVMPRGLDVATLLVVGLGEADKLTELDHFKLGGIVAGALPGGPNGDVTLFAETPVGPLGADRVADIALGITLRSYAFDLYKSKKSDDADLERTVTLGVADTAAAEAAWAVSQAVGDGVVLARNLVNEPANVLGPVEFADRVSRLRDLGVEVKVMEPAELERLEMRALLAVAQGSVRPARVVVMEWKGGPGDVKPVALVGKGVVFDTGGISIKPAGGMEDMKGDMGGAAAVVGTMHALAARKAKVNAVGIIGLVENMPDGNAQRPGDIVTAKSGTTIEVINTDAEGRLVLADLLTYTIETFSPRVMIDLATLTGAIIVALGHYHAGLYTDDDTVAAQLSEAGAATGDLVWRMPLGKDYDGMIDSKVADVKNTGGRWAGSITAAQFLKRFAGDSLWVHLDVAGTAMGAPSNEVSRTFGSGFGVRLLDRFVADFYEEGADSLPRGPAA